MLKRVLSRTRIAYSRLLANSFADGLPEVVMRADIALWAARIAMRMDGDLVKCGSLHGFFPDVIDQAGKRYLIFDKGNVIDAIKRAKIDLVSYLSLDLEDAQVELEIVELLWPRIAPGAIVLIEGYGATPSAWDEFARMHRFSIAALPTGQGLVVRPSVGAGIHGSPRIGSAKRLPPIRLQ